MPPDPARRDVLSDQSVFDRDPCDGCDGSCGDVCPVLEAQRHALERAVPTTGSAHRRRARDEADSALDRLRAENMWLRNQMGDVRGMQSDGATPEEMDEALGRALAGERARQAFDESRRSTDETNAPKETDA